MDTQQQQADVTVIGAGIIGISCALQLQKKGYHVTVVDRLPPGEGTSYGNAGVFARCGCVPVAVPGFAFKVPGLMMDPYGPLSLPVSYMHRATPWGMNFVWNSRTSKVKQIAGALDALLKDTTQLHVAQAKEAGAEAWAKASPYYYLYKDEANFMNDGFAWNTRMDHGIEFDILQGAAIREVEPAVSTEFNYAVSLKGHGFSANPEKLVKGLARGFEAQGGRILLADVRDIEFEQGRPTRLVTHKERLPIRHLVVAGGAWSAKLVEKLDGKVPLESERGYHIEVRDPGIQLHSPIMFAEGKLVATPMEGGIRFAGLVEFGGLEAKPNAKFAKRLFHHAKRLFPEIDTRNAVEWMGHRPSMPDSLPVIGRSPQHGNVFYAFGHQHMGLTLGPRTGMLIADLMSGAESAIDLTPYRIERFF